MTGASWLLALLVGAGAPGPSVAAGVALPFRPPLDRTINVAIDQQYWGRDDRPRSVRLVKSVRFARESDGYVLIATLQTVAADATADERHRAHAAFAAAIGVERRYSLDPQGRLTGLADMDAAWASFRNDQAALAVAQHPDPARGKAVLARLDALPAAERLMILGGDVAPLVRTYGQMLTAGREANARELCETESAADERTRTHASSCYDRSTGLLTRLERRVVVVGREAMPFVETWVVSAD